MLNTIFGPKVGGLARSGLALIVTSYALVGCVSAIDENSGQTDSNVDQTSQAVAATNEPVAATNEPVIADGAKDTAAHPPKLTVAEFQARARPNDIIILPVVSFVAASGNTTNVGTNVTLTVTSDQDIGPTPYYLQIFDATTGGRVVACGFGTTCSGNVSQSAATTHAYVGYLASGLEGTNPPSGVVSTSANTFVTWNNLGYRVSVPVQVTCFEPHGSAVITATANIDVGPTPYFIEIFNQAGTRIGVCGSGSTCQGAGSCGSVGVYYGFIALGSTSFPPSGIQASSNAGVEFPQPS